LRLDKYLFVSKLCDSRTKASELIKEKKIRVDGKIATKPSLEVDENSIIELLDTKVYVSRAAKKLKAIFKSAKIDIKDKIALDIGSSTGGFVEVLLEEGAKEVWAVDVGSNQLHKKIKSNPKVKSFENCDIREFESKTKFDIITCDISFISITHILDKINSLAKDKIITLFKPQFEVGLKAKRDRNGVVKDEKAISEARERFEKMCKTLGWQKRLDIISPIKGKEGNVEMIYYFIKEDRC
jgi:23S rRNA (cytidine1920-2'-O)/16S rRNA (cytidine1409-2'-O)-methyltransferase